MTLITAVTNILNKRVTEEQAKQFALDQYGVLAAYIRSQVISELAKSNMTDLANKNKVRKKAQRHLELKQK